MPDLPRDPRQLARDILAGKVSIEELAREQQRRRNAAAGPRQNVPQQRVPQKIPLPRPPMQNQPPRPAVRQPPPVLPRPAPRPRPVQQVPTAKARAQPPRAVVQATAPVNQTPVAQARAAAESQTANNRAKPAPPPRSFAIRQLLGSREAARKAIVMAEILGKPLALREDDHFP